LSGYRAASHEEKGKNDQPEPGKDDIGQHQQREGHFSMFFRKDRFHRTSSGYYWFHYTTRATAWHLKEDLLTPAQCGRLLLKIL
jgi:hypothetical protein